jgi:DNA-binding transcriptional regulator YiaG
MGSDIKRVRAGLDLTQARFAELLGVHLVTVKKWETDALHPSPMARAFLALLKDPVIARRVVWRLTHAT